MISVGQTSCLSMSLLFDAKMVIDDGQLTKLGLAFDRLLQLWIVFLIASTEKSYVRMRYA